MFSQHLLSSRAFLQAVAYTVGAVAIVCVAGWSAFVVGLTFVGLVNAQLIDGSGRAQVGAVAPAGEIASSQASVAAATASFASSTSSALTATEPAVPSRPATIVPLRTSSDNPDHDPAADFHNGTEGTFRTYCVRLCDGFFWPISFSTSAERFDTDAAACTSACASPARLFVHKMPGGGPGTMVALNGLRYSALKTAFQFRTRYDAQCTCQPQPWEEAAKDRHRLMAAMEAARKGSRVAAAEAQALGAKVDAQRRDTLAARDAANVRADRELTAIATKVELDPPRRLAQERRPSAEKTARAFDLRGAAVMRLGVEPAQPSRGRFIPASGNGRAWKDRVFNDN